MSPWGSKLAQDRSIMLVDSNDFREVMGRFASGVTVVTTVNDGSLSGFTASSFSSLSLDPPLVLVCLGRDALCHDAFVRGDCFAVNILVREQEGLSVRFSTESEDRFSGIAHQTWETGAPILDGSLAAIDCRLEAVHEGGDHSILVGRVAKLAVMDGESAPLVYYRGGYRSLDL